MQIVNLFRIDPGQGAREEICLLLVVPLNRDAIARADERFKSLDDRRLIQYSTIGIGADGRQAFRLS